MKNIRRIAMTGKRADTVYALIPRLVRMLQTSATQVLLDKALADALPDLAELPRFEWDTLSEEVDALMVVGGDGTMLDAGRRIAPQNVPVVGINQGHLGFLTDLSGDLEKLQQQFELLLNGQFTQEHRALLLAQVWRGHECVFQSRAWNDVVVSKGETGRLIELQVELDDDFLFSLRADGIIAATPTGSTAYALSAQGPILHPALAGIALVPLCPHALSHRPITIADRHLISVTLLSSSHARVYCDGQVDADLSSGDVISVQRSPESVTLLHPPDYKYFEMLQAKLDWSTRLREISPASQEKTRKPDAC